MIIHEYQAKQILQKHGILIPKGAIAYTPASAKKIAAEISLGGPWVVKSQIYSGGRNSGHFKEEKAGKEGGIRIAKSKREVFEEAQKMLGATLVTEQTGSKGKVINKVYVEKYKKTQKIFYIGMIIDRMKPAITLLVSPTVEDDIVEISLSNPEKILKIPLDLDDGAKVVQVRQVLDFLNLPSNSFKNLKTLIDGMYNTFIEYDAKMIEISPIGLTKHGELIALDAKMVFDKAALYRHKDVNILKDETEYLKRDLAASKFGFTYEEFDGNVGLITNGDGITLAMIDLLKEKNFEAACFLNVKGGVDKDKISAGIKLIMTDPKTEGILINILGGFLRCNLIAEGIISAAEEVGLNVPLVVRFEGTNKQYAKEILLNSKLPIKICDEMEEAVEQLILLMKEIN